MAKIIYLDYAATTPVDPEVLRAMLPYLKEDYGNPSSVHYFGQRARIGVEASREKLARFLHCLPEEIIFCGSATEANNLAITGLLKPYISKAKKRHIVTTQIEHHAVLEPYKELEDQGVVVTYLPVNRDGLVNVFELEKAITADTVLVSIMYANNEIGTIQPIAKIGKILESKSREFKTKIFFHTDAVQAVNYLDCNVVNLGVDLLTLSAHKIYGPKGVGVLYVKKGTPLVPIIYGGGQEKNLRSGTENVAGIVGLGAAIENVIKQKGKVKKTLKLRDRLIKEIIKKIPEVLLNGSLSERLPNNINFSFKGAEGEAIVIALDQEGIAVSTGSACSSKSLEPSNVLMSLGLSEQEAHTSLRISLGRYTTESEINKFLKVLTKTITRLRKISGYRIVA
ncbi:MAG: cysteine desulfurase NifS [Candidatus Nealsonbacteria bacterium CG_4_10_14_0_2_um_filter_38_17]|uniref:cysteine desulfurase n=2 Tax=Candidatus Nealsoniibacteriota TaxID=1817911 RepID=A0A2M7UXU9_9BACT|nr:MAG: cysteine desulfurase NifS [Candidatus Nealsonbacteria bacterium CG23_combo_of_CG06-09_8_20_14_all_38_19]PIZ88811.1 MAG: cysteine desulfurase NifS [Candidatus Nealsonbacteria bacterium CG_4_10_14_0_2_um_filter_38_17]